jgi:membrane-bound metal-dependent hydrolase YbcI (DUF457 family)
MGYVIHKLHQAREPGRSLGQVGPLPGLLIVTAGLSLLPDVDSIAGFLLQDFGRYHNSLSHSLFVGLVVALLLGQLAWGIQHSGFVDWFVLALCCYELHIVLDFFTVGRGVMLFWPLSSARFQPPVFLFYGLHWSDGIVSIKHLWTLLSELAFVALVVLSVHISYQKLTGHKAASVFPDPHAHNAPDER